jgi:hypothetical protein
MSPFLLFSFKVLVGTPLEFANINIQSIGLDGDDAASIYYAGSRANYSYHFHHDAAATWDFWERVKEETDLNASF